MSITPPLNEYINVLHSLCVSIHVDSAHKIFRNSHNIYAAEFFKAHVDA